MGIELRHSGLDTRISIETPDDGLPLYLVVEQSPLIAQDIADSLEAAGPCRVIHVSRLDAAEVALQAAGRVTAAFVEARLPDLAASGLDRLLRDRGAHIILTLGEDGQEAAIAQGHSCLVRPFTDQMIRRVLRRIVQEGNGADR